jgi:hypothetical protein
MGVRPCDMAGRAALSCAIAALRENAMKTLLFAGLLISQPACAQQAPAPPPRVVPDASGGESAAEAFRKLPICSLAPGGKKLLVEPCRPAPSRNFAQRRHAEQAPLPQLARPPATANLPVPLPPPATVAPSSTRPLGPCDAAGCRDASGTRYQGTGPVVLDPSGRPCRTDGQWVQC